MKTSPVHCSKSMSTTISAERTEHILRCLETGNGLDQISVQEYLQVSLLYLMANEEVHLEEALMYGGSVYMLHACVQSVEPGPEFEAMRNRV